MSMAPIIAHTNSGRTKEFIASGHSAVDALNNWSFDAQVWLDNRGITYADVEWIVPPEFKTTDDGWAVYGRIGLRS